MKLFSPTEIAASKATELARDVMRTQDIKKALDSARDTLNNTKAEFDMTLANQRVKWLKEEEVALNKIKDLQHEIEQLTKVRERSLIPIEIEQKRVDNILMEANELNTRATNKQKYADEMAEKLQDRLDEVSEKEEALEQRETHLFARETGSKLQEEAIKRNSQELTKQMQDWITETTIKEAKLQEQRIAIELREITIKEKELDIADREAQIEKEKSLIYSQRMALKAALNTTKI